MQLTITPRNRHASNCLLLVGGSGDDAAKFQPLADLLSAQLPEHLICTFSLSQQSQEGTSLLDLQAAELTEVMAELVHAHRFISYDIFATSMGAYAAIKLLLTPAYSPLFSRVILLDPADYYLSDTFSDPNSEITWSGYQAYAPAKPVISSQLSHYQGRAVIDVVHLTVRNHGPQGYVHSDHTKRGEDTPDAYPRLSTQMVKQFYHQVPAQNRGQYIELNHVPHGFFRDGNLASNLHKVSTLLARLLLINPKTD